MQEESAIFLVTELCDGGDFSELNHGIDDPQARSCCAGIAWEMQASFTMSRVTKYTLGSTSISVAIAAAAAAATSFSFLHPPLLLSLLQLLRLLQLLLRQNL